MTASAQATPRGASDSDQDSDIRANVGTEPHLLLSIVEAARCLGISRTHLYEIISRGEITSVRLGRRRMFRRRDLETFVAELGEVSLS